MQQKEENMQTTKIDEFLKVKKITTIQSVWSKSAEFKEKPNRLYTHFNGTNKQNFTVSNNLAKIGWLYLWYLNILQ